MWWQDANYSTPRISSRSNTSYETAGQGWNLLTSAVGANTFTMSLQNDSATGWGTMLSDSIPRISGWRMFVVFITPTQIDVYIDGKLFVSKAQSVTYSASNAPFTINTSQSEDYKIALLRASATALTADQIAKIYRDEKALFTDGAQATLYGSSDAVTALAYDEKTELRHVGTASGRSDFSGLRRINNTTTAITTSISAHNNLIAEQ